MIVTPKILTQNEYCEEKKFDGFSWRTMVSLCKSEHGNNINLETRLFSLKHKLTWKHRKTIYDSYWIWEEHFQIENYSFKQLKLGNVFAS